MFKTYFSGHNKVGGGHCPMVCLLIKPVALVSAPKNSVNYLILAFPCFVYFERTTWFVELIYALLHTTHVVYLIKFLLVDHDTRGRFCCCCCCCCPPGRNRGGGVRSFRARRDLFLTNLRTDNDVMHRNICAYDSRKQTNK